MAAIRVRGRPSISVRYKEGMVRPSIHLSSGRRSKQRHGTSSREEYPSRGFFGRRTGGCGWSAFADGDRPRTGGERLGQLILLTSGWKLVTRELPGADGNVGIEFESGWRGENQTLCHSRTSNGRLPASGGRDSSGCRTTAWGSVRTRPPNCAASCRFHQLQDHVGDLQQVVVGFELFRVDAENVLQV